MGLVVAMACVTWRGPVSMQPKTSSMAIVRAQIGFTEAKGWNHNRRIAEMLPSSARKLKHPLIFYFGLLGECFDRRDSRAFTAFVPEKLLVFQSSNNINSYNQITRGVLSY